MMNVERRNIVDEKALFDRKHSKRIEANSRELMDSTESEDTGVFSAEISKRCTSLNPNDYDEELDESESEATNVFSPDIPPQSRFVKSLNAHSSKENTPPSTETHNIPKQVENIEKKDVIRKRHGRDVLNTQNSDDDSSNQNVEEDIFDDLEKQIQNKKRVKRFRLSVEVSTNDSIFDDTEIGASSQEENRSKRKRGFVVTTNTQENDESTYSEVFKSASQTENKAARKPRFVAPQSFLESEDSLPISDVFKSSTKKSKRSPHFKIPKSSLGSQDSTSYSDVFKPLSQVEKKNNRKSRFVPVPSSLESDDSSSNYSEVFKSSSKDKKMKRKHGFIVPSCSQDTDDSDHYSDIFQSVSKNVTVNKNARTDRFIPLQDSENTLNYSDISVVQKKNTKHCFNDPSSQETEDSQRYSDISVSLNDTNANRNPPFVDPTSQEVGESFHYSDIAISNEKNTNLENSSEKEKQTCEKTSSTVSTSIRSIYIDTTRSSIQVSEIPSANKLINQTYDVSSAFCLRDNVPSLVNIDVSNNNDTYVHDISHLNASNECTLVGSNSLANANASATLIESKNESSIVQESIPITDESKQESITAHESISISIESKQESTTAHESISISSESKQESTIANESVSESSESKQDSTTAQESIPITDESKQANTSAQDSIPVTDESKIKNFDDEESNSIADKSANNSISIQKSVSGSENLSHSAKNSPRKLDEVAELNVTPAASVSIALIDSIPNSSSIPSSNEKIVEESVYVAFNPSSLMLSMTELVEASSNPVVDNRSSRLDEQPAADDIQSCEISPVNPPPAIALNEENIKEHDYAMAHISTAENPIMVPSAEKLSIESAKEEIVAKPVGVDQLFPIADELDKSSSSTSPANATQPLENPVASKQNDSLHTRKSLSNESNEPNIPANLEMPISVPSELQQPLLTADELNKSSTSPAKATQPLENPVASKQNDSLHTRKSLSNESNKLNIPANLEMPISVPSELQQSLLTADEFNKSSSSISPANVTQPREDSVASKQNYSLRTRKSLSNESNKQNIPTNLEAPISAPSGLQQPLLTADELNKSSASISPTNVTQPREDSVASNGPASKPNYSLRSRKSPNTRKSLKPVPSTSAAAYAEKSPEPVPSTSAAAFDNYQLDDSGDGLFNFSNSANGIPSRNSTGITSQGRSYSSRSRNFSSQTFESKGSVSVFSMSQIGRRSSPSKEFKVPQVPKIAAKKKRKSDLDPSLKNLPSRPNFPKFDSYCNKRFYDYLTSKMKPKHGIRTNNKAVELAKYVSEVVNEVIDMENGEHHILIEEMKKVLFKAGIVTTHYNFYMFCFDYLPAWFRRKAIPIMQPVDYPSNVQFDLSLLFESIG